MATMEQKVQQAFRVLVRAGEIDSIPAGGGTVGQLRETLHSMIKEGSLSTMDESDVDNVTDAELINYVLDEW